MLLPVLEINPSEDQVLKRESKFVTRDDSLWITDNAPFHDCSSRMVTLKKKKLSLRLG